MLIDLGWPWPCALEYPAPVSGWHGQAVVTTPALAAEPTARAGWPGGHVR